jgi:CPA1 family monovalent cation:H+ antiporter
MNTLDVVAFLAVLTAMGSILNERFFKFQETTFLMAFQIVVTGAVVSVSYFFPDLGLKEMYGTLVSSVDFREILFDWLLLPLLFAGAMNTKIALFRKHIIPILLFATVGVMISTAVIGFGMWYTGVIGVLAIALVFGALISPTDPISVLATLKSIHGMPEAVEMKIAGDSLLNDGAGVIAVTVLSAIAFGATHAHSGGDMALASAWEVFGGMGLGLLVGYIGCLGMRLINKAHVEGWVTFAIVLVMASLTKHLHISGPLAAVVAGLLVGNFGFKFSMSKRSRKQVAGLWHWADEWLNMFLFTLVGMEVFLIAAKPQYIIPSLIAIVVVTFGRWASVIIPIKLLSLKRQFTKGVVTIMTWGGLRGGISLALVLALPDNPYKEMLITITYAVVAWTIFVQGLTFKWAINRFMMPHLMGRNV